MIKQGDKVRVHVLSTSQIPNNPVKKFHGQEFIVDNVKVYYRYSNRMQKKQFNLEGCVSKYGMPYWFTEDELIKVGDHE